MRRELILLHGALGSSIQFDRISPLFKDINVHTFDFDGHGAKASDNKPFSIELFAQNIIDFVIQKNITAASVFGYSMGGYAALYAASLKPALFNNVMTLGTKFYWTGAYADKETLYLNPDLMQQKVPAFTAELMKRHGLHWKDVVYKTAKMMRHLGTNPLLNRDSINKLALPICVGVGDRDNTVSVEEALSVSKELTKGALLVLPNTPHPFDKVHPGLISSCITEAMLL